MKSNLALAGALVLVGLGACSAYLPATQAQGYGMEPGLTPGMGRPLGPAVTGTTMMGLAHLPDSLSEEQRAEVARIARELRERQVALMQQMRRPATVREDASPPFDEQAARREIDAQAGLHRELLENTIAARRRVDALLTPQQREEWRQAWARRR